MAKTFEEWFAKNQKYVEPKDINAWLQEAFEAGLASKAETATKLADSLRYAIRQGEHDILPTGSELREWRGALEQFDAEEAEHDRTKVHSSTRLDCQQG